MFSHHLFEYLLYAVSPLGTPPYIISVITHKTQKDTFLKLLLRYIVQYNVIYQGCNDMSWIHVICVTHSTVRILIIFITPGSLLLVLAHDHLGRKQALCWRSELYVTGRGGCGVG